MDVPVKVPGGGPMPWQKKTEMKRILHNAGGVVHKGRFLAIIGGSGAGKSTLLNALSNRTPPTSGTVFMNNTALQVPLAQNPPHNPRNFYCSAVLSLDNHTITGDTVTKPTYGVCDARRHCHENSYLWGGVDIFSTVTTPRNDRGGVFVDLPTCTAKQKFFLLLF